MSYPGDALMSCPTRRNRGFFRSIVLFDSIFNLLSSRRNRDDLSKRGRASLRLTSLEDRLVPTGSLTIPMWDAVGYTGKTVSIRLHHDGSGTSAGTVNWGDGSGTD